LRQLCHKVSHQINNDGFALLSNLIMFNCHFYSGREYENLIMDCCQLEDGVTGVKREDTAGNDPENGSPDADRGGTKRSLI